jgi:multidrug transporter EmrE-like cation transporter
MIHWLWLALALIATGVGQICFKAYAISKRNSLLAATAVSFCFAPPSTYMALLHIPLSTVYTSTAIVQFGIVVMSMLLFGERFRPLQWAGLALILLGVFIFNI